MCACLRLSRTVPVLRPALCSTENKFADATSVLHVVQTAPRFEAKRRLPISRATAAIMQSSRRAMATLCVLMLAMTSLYSVQAARTLQASTCTVKLTGGLDALAGNTDITLAHNCGLGFAETLKVAGELTDFYQCADFSSHAFNLLHVFLKHSPGQCHPAPKPAVEAVYYGSPNWSQLTCKPTTVMTMIMPERRDSRLKCIFQDGKFQWCVQMEDNGGFNINSVLKYGGFSM